MNHIDTSDFYGPQVTNQIIKRALHPYPDELVIVTKVGARRGDDKSWIQALSKQELVDAVHDNLRNLGLDVLDVVNLRVGGLMGPSEGSIEEALTALAELKSQGLIPHLGISNVTPEQFLMPWKNHLHKLVLRVALLIRHRCPVGLPSFEGWPRKGRLQREQKRERYR